MKLSVPARAALLAACLVNASLADSDFVGAEACATCHESEYRAWQGSQHEMAMQHATAETVLGNFDDATFAAHGVSSRFFRRDGRFFVNTAGQDGSLHDFEVAYTFGVYPLQQYLVPFPGGRLQALNLAWDARPADSGGQRWFDLYPGEVIGPRDELHWTGPQQNWNYMCADCHSTNLAKGYDPASDRFQTTWSEIDVACEACHGPGGQHVRLAQSGTEGAGPGDPGQAVLFHERQEVSWTIDPATGMARRSSPNASRTEIDVCAGCHSRRGTLAPGVAARPGFLDHFMPAFLTGDLYYPDGQIQAEDYVWGSFLQSRMFAAGVTCSDCHDPHSLQLRAPGSAVCSTCHAPAKFATREHHGHPAGSTGSDCLACHMPTTTYMVVDPRRDHSIRIPRPDLSLEFGTPNACNQCHAGKSTEWAAAAFRQSFPDVGKPFQDWARAFSQARAGLPQAEVSLLSVLHDAATPDIARATAMLELRPFLSPLSGQALQQALHDASPLVRIAALRTLEALPPANRYAFAGHLLSDPLLAVRIEAGRVLAATPAAQLDSSGAQSMKNAIADYVATQDYDADRPESRVNLGNLEAMRGHPAQAEHYYREGIERRADFSPAYLNLADLYRQEGMERESRDVLQQGLQRAPQDPSLHHALGLALVRAHELDQGIGELAQAARLAPDVARFAYVWGVALNSAGRPGEAVATLQAAQRLHPNNREMLWALATIERDRGEYARALEWAEKLLALNPTDRQADSLAQSLRAEIQARK